MAILERIENYLDDMHAPFARRSHAQIEQISERKLAKIKLELKLVCVRFGPEPSRLAW